MCCVVCVQSDISRARTRYNDMVAPAADQVMMIRGMESIGVCLDCQKKIDEQNKGQQR